MVPQIEIACFNQQSALNAVAGGANRIELCEDMKVGGITPRLHLFSTVRQQVHIPIHVMIRPRSGNFVYSDEERRTMLESLQQLKESGADGFVFGMLTADGQIDAKNCTMMVKAAYPLPCTFHRAFDETARPGSALKAIIDCGFSYLLTSGGHADACSGMYRLKQMIRLCNEEIIIMPGGGIRSANLSALHHELEASWYHSAATLQDEIADTEEIRKMKRILSSSPMLE